MEINTEINRVFGQEMANLFASKLSEEEMLSVAQECWNSMTHHEYRYGDRQDSKIDDLVKGKIREAMAVKVGEITESEEFQSQAKRMAEEIVQDILVKTREKVVEEVSSRLAGMSVGGYGFGLKGMIEQTVQEMMYR